MTKKTATPAANEAPARKGMFAKFAQVDDATGGADLVNFSLQLGSNKVRVLTEPMMVRKHWDLPQSADIKGAVPCRKLVTDFDAYAEDPAGYLASLPHCEYCEWEAEHPGFYTTKEHWVFNIVQDGVLKVAEFYQTSILRALSEFENDPDWAKMMKNGLSDLEINIKKEQTGPKPQNVKYSVGGVPGTEPLAPEQMEEYKANMVDLMALKAPPADTDEGNAKWAEYLSKAGKPKDGEKPKSFSN